MSGEQNSKRKSKSHQEPPRVSSAVGREGTGKSRAALPRWLKRDVSSIRCRWQLFRCDRDVRQEYQHRRGIWNPSLIVCACITTSGSSADPFCPSTGLVSLGLPPPSDGSPRPPMGAGLLRRIQPRIKSALRAGRFWPRGRGRGLLQPGSGAAARVNRWCRVLSR